MLNSTVLLFSSDKDLYKPFSTPTQTALLAANLALALLRLYLADRTIFARRINSWITIQKNDGILTNINYQNLALTAVAAKLIASGFCNGTASAATLTTENGLTCYRIAMAPAFMKKRYTELRQCFKCYPCMHFTKKCTRQ